MMIRARGWLALGVLGCTTPPVPEQLEVEPAVVEPVVVESRAVTVVEPLGPEEVLRQLASSRCGEVAAIWRGHDVRDPDGEFPITSVEFGFETLAFRFDAGPHAGTTIDFDPSGTLFFSDWQLEVFSPDCRRVVLLQDRFGPYHVVAVDRLPDYLLGRAEPEAILTGCEGCSAAAVHADARWIDADTLEFETGACGTTETQRVDLPSKSKCPE
jgi:hypothetical protein